MITWKSAWTKKGSRQQQLKAQASITARALAEAQGWWSDWYLARNPPATTTIIVSDVVCLLIAFCVGLLSGSYNSTWHQNWITVAVLLARLIHSHNSASTSTSTTDNGRQTLCCDASRKTRSQTMYVRHTHEIIIRINTLKAHHMGFEGRRSWWACGSLLSPRAMVTRDFVWQINWFCC